jgi:hypothetical protein
MLKDKKVYKNVILLSGFVSLVTCFIVRLFAMAAYTSSNTKTIRRISETQISSTTWIYWPDNNDKSVYSKFEETRECTNIIIITYGMESTTCDRTPYHQEIRSLPADAHLACGYYLTNLACNGMYRGRLPLCMVWIALGLSHVPVGAAKSYTIQSKTARYCSLLGTVPGI